MLLSGAASVSVSVSKVLGIAPHDFSSYLIPVSTPITRVRTDKNYVKELRLQKNITKDAL